MSMFLDRFCLIVSFAKPAAAELSVSIGVAGCVWPSSLSVTRIGKASCPFRNKVPIPASAAERGKDVAHDLACGVDWAIASRLFSRCLLGIRLVVA
jgi:hypothetical protein